MMPLSEYEWVEIEFCHIMVTISNFLGQIQYQISYAAFQLHTRSIIPEIFILGYYLFN